MWPTQGRLGAMNNQEIEVELVSNTIRRYEYGLTVSIQGVGKDVMTLPIAAKYATHFMQINSRLFALQTVLHMYS